MNDVPSSAGSCIDGKNRNTLAQYVLYPADGTIPTIEYYCNNNENSSIAMDESDVAEFLCDIAVD
jgi:hypothetical protein